MERIAIDPYVQPIMSYNSLNGALSPTGYEILARGRVGRRIITPEGLCQVYDWAELDNLVLESVADCSCQVCLLETTKRKIFINLSPRTIMQPSLFSNWFKMLQKLNKAHPRQLVVEINEMTDPAYCANTIVELQTMGVEVALDDYGRGYDPEGQLLSAEWDFVKIDQLAYKGRYGLMLQDINYCLAAGIKVIVEKIEHFSDITKLAAEGVTYFQGYALCQPVHPSEVNDPIYQTDSVHSSRVVHIAG